MKLAFVLSLLVATPAFAADPPPKPKTEKKAPPTEKPVDRPADKPADKPTPTPTKPPMMPREAKQVEAFFDDLFAAVVQNQTDCPKMGPAINGVLDKHAAFLKQAGSIDKEPPPALKAKIEKKQNDFVQALMKCTSDKGVMAAIERMTKMTEKK